MRAVRLQTEYMTTPLGIGNLNPRFFWNCEGGRTQSAYQIIASREGKIIWDTGKVLSSDMTHIPYKGKSLMSRDVVQWKVTLWDENDCAGETSESFFEIGLTDAAELSAKWISGDYKPDPKKRYPVDYFSKSFSLKPGKRIKKARIYATARGVYDVTIDGITIRDFVLAPGMTDYRKRIQLQTYDVTSILTKGSTDDHSIELRLADGWFRGSVAAYGVRNVFGTRTSIIIQLEITYEDGEKTVIATDESWKWADDGPIRFADLKDGEVYDASEEASYKKNAKAIAPPKGVLIEPSGNVPVKEHEEFSASILKAVDGINVLDFGQNIAGILEFTVNGKKGQKLKVTCGEVLDESGCVDLKGVQESIPAKGWNQMRLISKLMGKPVRGDVTFTPKQEIVFICSGDEDHYKMSFSVFGFRYAQIEADKDINIEPSKFKAIAVYSDMEQTGDFKCSNELVSRLVENTRWSMKGNFLDVPTDCPTRERLGWTGDAQLFFNTGAYLMNTAPFFAKWLRDMRDDQYANGLISAVVPFSGVEMMYKSTGTSVGWADAVYLVPYRYSKMYQDKEALKSSWSSIKKYADYLMGHLGMRDKKDARSNPYNEYTYEKGIHLGEWLEPEEFRDAVYGTAAKHPEECTAYLYLAMKTIAEIADVVGEADYGKRLREVARGSQEAYVAQFVRSDKSDTDRQAKLVRPLAMGLLEGEEYRPDKEKARQRLVQAIEKYGYRVGTGFLSTPFILPVLTDADRIEEAYKVLENEERPGWLSEIKAGATTVWENWEGNLSQNHYSPGAVCEWLFGTVAGIRLVGERQFEITPVPGGTLTEASARWLSIYGEVKSSWKKNEDGTYSYTVVIPSNTGARLKTHDGRVYELSSGENIVVA